MTWGLLLEGAHLMPKAKTCKQCGSSFTPHRPMATVCSPTCARRLVNAQKKQEAERKKLERALDAAKRRGMMSVKKLKALAQKEFNIWVRMRDAHEPCISCGEMNPPVTTGGQWDAGHFISRGSHPELAFDEDNVHKQCKACNGASKYNKAKEATVSQCYEENLIKKIGQERVDRLKGPHEVVPLEKETLRQIATIYRARVRDLKKGKA